MTPHRMTDAQDTRPHYVYRIFDKADRLLYVGCSIDWVGRIESFHKSLWSSTVGSPAWLMYGLIDHYDAELYPTRAIGREVERAAIAAADPLFNKQHNLGRNITREKYDELYKEAEPAEKRKAREDAVNFIFGSQASLDAWSARITARAAERPAA